MAVDIRAGNLGIRRTFSTRGSRLILAAFAVSVSWLVVYRTLISTAAFGDLKVYRAEGFAVRAGGDIYGQLAGVDHLTTYPVFGAICFTPLTLVPYGMAAFLVAVGNVVIVPWLSITSFRIVGWGHDRAVVAGLGLATVALWMEPVYSTFDYAQVNLLLLALVLLDFRPGRTSRGVGLGLAAAIKVTPLIFLVYLVLTRRWRTAAGALAVFVVAQLVSLAVDASATWRYWTKYLFDLPRVGRLENAVNQTIRGMGVRFEHTRETGFVVTLAVMVVAVAGLAVAAFAYQRLGEAPGLLAVAVTGLLASPISWSHHWVWCIPLVALLWARYDRRLAVAYAVVFLSFVVWWLPQDEVSEPELHYAVWQVFASGAYVYLGLAFLVVTAVKTHRVGSSAPAARETVVPRQRRASDAVGDL